MSIRFDNRVAIVTGGGTGIGRATALRLAQAGARAVYVNYSRSSEDAEATARALIDLGCEGIPHRCNVAVDSECREMVAAAVGRFGRLDVLVNNAGTTHHIPHRELEALSDQVWEDILSVNLRGAFLCARAAWPSMKARRKGRILAVGSISGTLGTPLSSAYNASKWGLTGFIKSIAEEGREHGIFCAAVLPGSTDTDMLAQTPFPPLLEAEEVAKVVRFLATEAPFAMTGSAVEVFG